MNLFLNDLLLIIPQFFLLFSAIILLMLGSFTKKNSAKIVVYFSVLTLFLVTFLEILMPWDIHVIFNNSLVENGFSRFVKSIIFMSSAFVIILSSKWLIRYDEKAFEYPILILFSSLGMSLMISANDLITLYLAIELQSLPLYVMAAFKRDSVESGEAGIKYFVLGALSSSLFLFGSSLIYGFTGSIEFSEISRSIDILNINSGIVVGIVFILSGLIFKISAVPFHMWTPDVYEGSATPITAFFATAPKMAAMCMLVNILYGPFSGAFESWQQIIIFVSIASMSLGSFVAIRQTNIKRLLAYSSISHMGFALIGLISPLSQLGVQALLIYMLIYIVTNLGVFACIISLEKNEGETISNTDDLSGLSKKYPFISFSMAMLMFSFAGIPPLAGFFGKYLIFRSAIENGLIEIAVFGLIISVVAAFYYIRIIKIMYFDESNIKITMLSSKGLNITNVICTIFIVFFIFIYSIFPISELADLAASSIN
ncbi:MAG: NADH-quinone oxidoreductase subunit NuoN [Hyphomicrobiales bacterium]|jgi:NADH-quinone oxidoreductase subunit N|nr:NADH-quinone oxidoreductase subunit NuoN [Hyphomicrobiales bacterium]